MDQKIKYIAKACHEANRVWCQANGDDTQPHWEDAPQWQRNSAINGVRFRLDNPEATPETMHQNWMQQKIAEGWVYGETKSEEYKTHPCMVPYQELPEFQRVKDRLFSAIVDAMSGRQKETPVEETVVLTEEEQIEAICLEVASEAIPVSEAPKPKKKTKS